MRRRIVALLLLVFSACVPPPDTQMTLSSVPPATVDEGQQATGLA